MDQRNLRKWKDEGSHIIKPFQRRLYFIIALVIISRSFVDLFILGSMDWMDYLNIGLGAFMIWGINRNGFYKIARRYAEYVVRKKDNKWR